MFTDTLTPWDQGANVHTWSHTPCVDEQTYAHTHIHSLWVSDLICTYLHTHTLGQLLIDLYMHIHTHTLKVSVVMDSSPDVL